MAKQNGWLVASRWSEFDGGLSATVEYPEVTREELVKAVHYCRKRIMLRVATNPRSAVHYLRGIYRYHGFKNTIRDLIGKLEYVLLH